MGISEMSGRLPVAILVGLVFCACTRASDDPQVDRDAIAAASREFSAAYTRGDTAVIGHLYTDSAQLIPPGRVIRGRENITRYFAPVPKRTVLSHQMKSDTLTVDGNTAIDVGVWSSSWQRDGDTVQTVSDRYLVVWKRGADGNWRMEFDMWHRPTD
jgi:uncharacterized protein (TIGR02246 family)